MPDLNTLLDAHEALASGATNIARWEVRGSIVPAESVDVCFMDGTRHIRYPLANTGVCESGLRFDPKADAAHIAANDPATVRAFIAVARALDSFIANYDDFSHHPEFRAVAVSLDALKEVLDADSTH